MIAISVFIDYFIKNSGFSYCISFGFGAFAQSILILGGED